MCDFDESRLKKLSAKYPGKKVTNNWVDIIDDLSIDIVSVASYDNYHAEQITQALENKKHIMAEKPLCLRRDEMDNIRRTLEKNPNVYLSSNLVLRTNSRFEKIRQDISQKKLGDVYYIEADYYWGRKNKLYNWRAKMDFYSIILGAAVHMIDLVMWLTDSKPISVQALGNDIATKDTNFKFNSFAVLLLQFNSGLIAKITGNGGCVHPHFHGLKIFGTEQTAVHNYGGAYYLNSSDPEADLRAISEPYPEKEAREKLIHNFIDHIVEPSQASLVPQQDVFDIMSVCFAAEEAMKAGQKIAIEYLD